MAAATATDSNKPPLEGNWTKYVGVYSNGWIYESKYGAYVWVPAGQTSISASINNGGAFQNIDLDALKKEANPQASQQNQDQKSQEPKPTTKTEIIGGEKYIVSSDGWAWKENEPNRIYNYEQLVKDTAYQEQNRKEMEQEAQSHWGDKSYIQNKVYTPDGKIMGTFNGQWVVVDAKGNWTKYDNQDAARTAMYGPDTQFDKDEITKSREQEEQEIITGSKNKVETQWKAQEIDGKIVLTAPNGNKFAFDDANDAAFFVRSGKWEASPVETYAISPYGGWHIENSKGETVKTMTGDMNYRDLENEWRKLENEKYADRTFSWISPTGEKHENLSYEQLQSLLDKNELKNVDNLHNFQNDQLYNLLDRAGTADYWTSAFSSNYADIPNRPEVLELSPNGRADKGLKAPDEGADTDRLQAFKDADFGYKKTLGSPESYKNEGYKNDPAAYTDMKNFMTDQATQTVQAGGAVPSWAQNALSSRQGNVAAQAYGQAIKNDMNRRQADFNHDFATDKQNFANAVRYKQQNFDNELINTAYAAQMKNIAEQNLGTDWMNQIIASGG